MEYASRIRIGMFVIVTVCAIAIILLNEYKQGRLKKPWYKWLTIAVFFLIPWLIIISTQIYKSFNPILAVVMLVVIVISIPLRSHLSQLGILGSKVQREEAFSYRMSKWAYRNPRILWSWEMITSGAIAAVSTVALSILLQLLADIEGLSEWRRDPNNLLGVLVLCSIWVLPTLVVVFSARFLGPLEIPSYGIVSGILVAIVSVLILRTHSWHLRLLIFMCPIFGGYLGEKLSAVLRLKTSKKARTNSVE